MLDEENWVIIVPFDGDPLVNIGYKHHFELLEEIAPELIKEVNYWAAGLQAPMSSERFLARGGVDHLNRIHFKECPGDRNHVHAILLEKVNAPFKFGARKSPFFETDNILNLFIARAMNERIPDEQDIADVTRYSKNLANCSPEEIRYCLDGVMKAENPAAAIRLMEETKALRYLLPEVADTKGFWQKYKRYSSELFSHLLMTLDCVAKHTNEEKKNLRWAALLHDIGKVKAVWVDDNGLTKFNDGPNGDHEALGAEMADELLTRIGLPEEDREYIVFMIANHMFDRFDDKKGAKQFIEDMGSVDRAYDMLTLGLGDEQGKRKQEEKEERIFEMRKMLDKVTRGDDWEEIAAGSELIVVLREHDII